MTASSAGSVPRNRQQVKDLPRRRDAEVGHGNKKRDPLFSVMLMCKESQGKEWSIREDSQLCTGTYDSFGQWLDSEWLRSVLYHWAVHNSMHRPNLQLGRFDVTVTTYRHPMLINSSGNHPVMMGPVMIHKQKSSKCTTFLPLHACL